jgi:formylglycine-generating enzyme required for sulfatase activity
MNDATLSLLVPSTGSLNPDFNPDITDYTVVVPYSVTNLIVTGRTLDVKATMDPVDGNLSFADLAVGTSSEQSIKVTSGDGATIKKYKIKVIRESNVSMLSDLIISTGTLSPAFNPSTMRYMVSVPYNVTNLIVTGRTSDGNATMDPPDGNLLFMNLAAGIWEKKTITVASEYKTITKTYKVRALRQYKISYTSENIGELMFIPAGSFQHDAREENISVITKPYSLSKYQITRQQFLDIMGADPSDTKSSNGMKDPVQMINWYHAIAFCNKLSIKEGLDPAYSVKVNDQEIVWENLVFGDIPSGDDYNHKNGDVGDANWNAATCDWEANGYRLPTKKEWMWAAMGADQDGREGAIQEGINRTGYSKAYAGEGYGTGTSIGDYTWYKENSRGKTQPVGGKLPNELGFYDMSGNVWEWGWDRYEKIDGTLKDYKGAGSGSFRVIRGGGCWSSKASIFLAADQVYLTPYGQFNDVGFRVLRPVL